MTRVRKQLPVPSVAGDPWYERIRCNWDECENPGSGLQKVKVCFAARPFRHHRSQTCPHCTHYAFCSAQHLDFWTRSHIPGEYGKLSAGVNGRYL